MTKLHDSNQPSFAYRFLIGAIFLALTALVLVGFLTVFAPPPPPEFVQPFESYDRKAMLDAVAPENIAEWHAKIMECGNRFPGYEGYYKVEKLIRNAYQDAGLDILEYPEKTVAPKTFRREILASDGNPVPNVQVYPFFPNHFQPIVTPDEGITGELVLVTDKVLLERKTFDDCIAVIDAYAPPKSYGVQWIEYARLGFRAVIVTHRDGMSAIKWPSMTVMTASTPVNFTRLAAQKSILEHLGETVTLHVRCGWNFMESKTVVGVMKAPNKDNSEALVITSNYDACSFLPDLAPGTAEAYNVAEQLALLDGLAQYRDELRRDIVFVSYGSQVMTQYTADRFTALLGTALAEDEGRLELEKRKRDNDTRLRATQACLELLDNQSIASPQVFNTAAEKLPAEAKKMLSEQVTYELNTVVAELSENVLQKRLDFIRVDEDVNSPEFTDYTSMKREYDLALSVAGYPLNKLIREKTEYIETYQFESRLVQRFKELLALHQQRQTQIDVGLQINKLLKGYRDFVVLGAYLLPGDPKTTTDEKISFTMGSGVEGGRYLQTPVIQKLIHQIHQSMPEERRPQIESMRQRSHSSLILTLSRLPNTDVRMWTDKGYAGFLMVNTDRPSSYDEIGAPVQPEYLKTPETIAKSLDLMGRTALSLAHGNQRFEAPTKVFLNDYSGTVYMGNVGQSMVPNYPLKHALIAHKGYTSSYSGRGVYPHAILFTDAYGNYDVPLSNIPMVNHGAPGYSPEVAGFDENWRINQTKDMGEKGQKIYRSILLGNTENVNIVTFRAAPVTILDMINPQTLKAFTGAQFITKKGLEGFDKFNLFSLADGIVTGFISPEEKFFVKLRAGAPENEKLQRTRAFILGVEPGYEGNPEKEIDGPGYLAADSTLIRNTARELAYSVHHVNDNRIQLQERYDMADDRTLQFHEQSEKLIEQSRKPNMPKHLQILDQRDAATYDILNHPVLRESISETVIGILWYLGLLVPFVFFFEKLVFAFPDIRKQLMAQAVIFLVIFSLLRILHPAFEMIRSSVMILLGFIIMLISGAITVLFSGKFQENLEELRQKRGQVTTAEANTMGVIGTAFSLGLNNMHRRAVRTGLTCATLVLITFAMICFTSVQNNIVDTTTAVGKAFYQGLLIKNEKMRNISSAETTALKAKYAHQYDVTTRTMTTGTTGWDQITRNPTYELTYAPADSESKRIRFASFIGLEHNDPLTGQIPMLTQRPWPSREEWREMNMDAEPVMIPESVARQAEITPEQVDSEIVVVEINGIRAWIAGIFNGDALNTLTDIDGRSILPPNVEALETVETEGGVVLADEKAPRLDGKQILISVGNKNYTAQNGHQRQCSVAVVMPNLSYKEAKEEIDKYLEQSGRATYYGLDGVTYRGQRARETSLAGIIELLIPLIIAAMTVLNTMKGSVYERRNEIFVYNAVGIAPRYIFAMFFSEAFVYSVVGSVLGYILSQGTGRVLTMLDMTGGLNMTFTSITTIYASLAITAAVFLSTLFPARSAMEIAAPAEESGWNLPEPEGDVMKFTLPFTFDYDGRIAVLAFFARYFEDHGEGGAGKFFAGHPRTLLIDSGDAVGSGEYVPQLLTTVWLKPFDLGVSQDIAISMPTDPETGEYIAEVTLTRLSGTRESWVRLNHSFVMLVRKHFLYWRAVTPEQRQELFAEAREAIRNFAARQESLNA